MKAGCSVDSATELEVTADGKLMILNKAKVGGASFELKSNQKKNILDALKNDSFKGEQAIEQRNCQQHYLDKIFEAIIPENKKIQKTDLTKSGEGYLFELEACNRVDRNSVNCTLSITSSFYDRKITLRPHMYDNFGNYYKASYITIANFQDKNRYLEASLIADVKTLANVKFVNVNTQATGISKLLLLEGIEYRALQIRSQ